MSIELNRSAFEAFAQRNEFGTYRTDRKGDGYDSSHTQLMWMAWCAAIQQAESAPVAEPSARVELIKTGGNAGLSTRIIELDIATRERLRPGDLLYTHPAPGVPGALKDHQIAALVNTLRDIARQFHWHDSLRERIANVLVPALKAEAKKETS